MSPLLMTGPRVRFPTQLQVLQKPGKQYCAKDFSLPRFLHILPGKCKNRCSDLLNGNAKTVCTILMSFIQVVFIESAKGHSKLFFFWFSIKMIKHCFNNVKVWALGRPIHGVVWYAFTVLALCLRSNTGESKSDITSLWSYFQHI